MTTLVRGAQCRPAVRDGRDCPVLGAETELLPGAMAAALRRLLDAGAGAVGGKLIRGHGRLELAAGLSGVTA